MAMFDNIFELVHTAGGYLGAGGGLVAGELYRRFNGARKDAKKAKEVAADALTKVESVALRLTQLAQAATQEWVSQEIQRILRGSLSGTGVNDVVSFRLQELERRMSSIEDQFDTNQQEERKWAEDIRTILGGLEEAVRQQQSRRRE